MRDKPFSKGGMLLSSLLLITLIHSVFICKITVEACCLDHLKNKSHLIYLTCIGRSKGAVQTDYPLTNSIDYFFLMHIVYMHSVTHLLLFKECFRGTNVSWNYYCFPSYWKSCIVRSLAVTLEWFELVGKLLHRLNFSCHSEMDGGPLSTKW